MKPVVMNRRLVLEGPEKAADGAGGFQESWSVLGHLWAEVTAGSGRETDGVGGPLSRTAYRIVVRAAPQGAPSRPIPGQRFRDGARMFRIEAVAERDGTGHFLTCFAQEEVAI